MGYIDYAAARPRPAEDCVVYLDHAATTPMLPEALAAMTEELGQLGNPSSLHNAGRRARRVVEESREQIAEVFGARPSEVIFTSGGTEADNLAVKGLYWARRAAAAGRSGHVPRRVLATAIEHHAVLDSVHWLAGHEDAEEHWLPVDETGVLQPAALAEAIGRRPGRGRPGHGDVGEQRGGRGAADRRARRAGPRARHPVPHRRGAGGRPAAGQLRGQRRGRDDHHRAQVRRPGGRGRAAAGPRGPAGPGAARRRPGERGALRHAGRPRHPGVRGRGGGHGQPPGRGGRPAGQAPRRPDRPGARGRAGRHPQRPARRDRAACPATRTSPSPAARATRC